MYDWANSVYSLVITSSLFPVYYGLVAKGGDGGNEVSFFGLRVVNSALFSFAVSFSFLLAGLASPWLTALSDIGNLRKRLLLTFCFLGSIATSSLFLFKGTNLEYGIIMFVMAAIGYSSSLVFYNSYLPTVASPDQYDKVSGRGFAFGYAGSVILLLLILLPVLAPGIFSGLNLSFIRVCQIGFMLTGVWWLGFGWNSIRQLPTEPDNSKRLAAERPRITERLKEAIGVIGNTPSLPTFLPGFFFVNTGVQTVMYLAALFGDQELHMEANSLIVTILILQLVAILGALGFSVLATQVGEIRTILVAVVLWIIVCVLAFGIQTPIQFYGVAALVGLVMGGTQSMMRSTFSSFVPSSESGKSTLYGFFDLLDKFSIVLGTAIYGLINQVTGSMRISSLALAVVFLIGGLMLANVRKIQKSH